MDMFVKRTEGFSITIISLMIILNSLSCKVYTCPYQCFCNNTEIHCGNKFLTNIPYDIPRYSTHLYLNGNFIKILKQSDFKELVHLKVLDVSSNRIKYIEGDAFKYQRSLKTLLLSDNPIGMIQSNLFKNLNRLERLGLTRIYNSSPLLIDDTAFLNLRELKELKLDQNKIVAIRNETFRGLSLLRLLDLSHNKLQFIEESSFQHFEETMILIIGNNVLLCCSRTVTAFKHLGIKTIGYCLNQLTVFEKSCDNTTKVNTTGKITLPKQSYKFATQYPFLNTIKPSLVNPMVSIKKTSKLIIESSGSFYSTERIEPTSKMNWDASINISSTFTDTGLTSNRVGFISLLNKSTFNKYFQKPYSTDPGDKQTVLATQYQRHLRNTVRGTVRNTVRNTVRSNITKNQVNNITLNFSRVLQNNVPLNTSSKATTNITCVCDNSTCSSNKTTCMKHANNRFTDSEKQYTWYITAIITITAATGCLLFLLIMCVKIRNKNGVFILWSNEDTSNG